MASTDRTPPCLVDGYIRVSRRMGREGPGYISPDVQREAIRRWAEYKGVEVAAWHVDEDWSGGTQERPGLELAVERAVSGETGGIVSWKIDRFSRYTEGGLRDLRRLEDAGARLAFVVEDVDTSGPMGKFVYTVMLAMAEYFLGSIKASWRTAKTRAHERGAKIGPTPFGYVRREDGTLESHVEHGPIVAEAFRQAAEHGLGAAVDYLAAQDVEHEDGKRKGRARAVTTSTVRRLLANRVYLGEVRWGDLPPVREERLQLVARATWEAAQPEDAKARRPARHYPLSGVARCGICGEAMVGGAAGRAKDGGSLRTYRCRASLKSWKGERCRGVNVVADNLEAHVRAELGELLREVWEAQEDTGGDFAAAELALQEADLALDHFLADTSGAALLRRVGRYEAELAAHVERVEEAQARYRQAASESARASFTVSEPEAIADASPEELGELARGGLAAIVVRPGRGKPLAGRVELIPLGNEADVGVSGSQD